MKLERCPFCGEVPLASVVNNDDPEFRQYQIICPWSSDGDTGCGAASGYYDSLEQAARAWNRRQRKEITKADIEEYCNRNSLTILENEFIYKISHNMPLSEDEMKKRRRLSL